MMGEDKGVEESSEAVSEPPSGSAAAGSRTVFLSYASADSEIASKVCQALEAQGVLCWMAPRDVKPGAQYADAIVRAINDAKALVLVLSPSAIGSSHVGREIERAASKHKQIIALKINAASLTPALEYFLSESQWIDATALGMPAALARLAEAVGQGSRTSRADLVSGSGGASGGSAVSPAVGTANVAKHVVFAAAIVIVLSLAATLAIHFWPTKHGVAQVRTVAAVSDKSIAVLPFADMSEKKDQEYFADGMAAEVINLLAKIPGLKVIGRTSSFQFKRSTQDLRTIGDTLGAAYLVEGTVLKSGERLRVTAQLIDAHDGSQRWSSTYDRKTGEAIEVQDAIAFNLARALQTAVGIFETRPAGQNAQAYDLYLRGIQAFDFSREGTDQAAGQFQQALDLEPSSSQATFGLALCYAFEGMEGWMPTRDAFERARTFANRAIQLDPEHGGAHAVLAKIHLVYDWDWPGAEREVQVALKLGEQLAAPEVAAQLAAMRGDWNQANHLIETALVVDPLNSSHLITRAIEIDLRSGQFAKAESSVRRALEISPNYGSARWALGLSLLFQGRLDEALATMQQESIDDGQLEGTAIVYHAMGKKAESDAARKRAVEHDGDSWPSAIARTYAFLGDSDQAMKWLEKAYVLKDEDLFAIKRDPLMKNMENDPRYQAFLRKMKFPE